MKPTIYLIFIILVSPGVLSTMNCTIKNQTCTATDMFHISAGTNAHAEQNNESSYSYIVCCSATQPITENCTATGSQSIINLSTSTNAHIELANETHYTFPVCLSTSAGSVTCSFSTSSCGEACLGRVSGNTNAHIENCTSDRYSKYLCCSHTDPSSPSEPTGSAPGGIIYEKRAEQCDGIWVNDTCVPKKEAEPEKKKIILSPLFLILIVFLCGLLFTMIHRLSNLYKSPPKRKDEKEEHLYT